MLLHAALDRSIAFTRHEVRVRREKAVVPITGRGARVTRESTESAGAGR